MTQKEAAYWKQFILRTIEERLPLVHPTDEDAYRISRFAKQFMQTVNGQTPLPQGLFREFLDLFGRIPAIQEEIVRAQDAINAYIAALPSEATDKEIEQLFNGEMVDADYMWLPSMDIDEEGYVRLNIEIDEEGWAHFVDE